MSLDCADLFGLRFEADVSAGVVGFLGEKNWGRRTENAWMAPVWIGYCSSKRAFVCLQFGQTWSSSRKKLRSWCGCFRWQTSWAMT